MLLGLPPCTLAAGPTGSGPWPALALVLLVAWAVGRSVSSGLPARVLSALTWRRRVAAVAVTAVPGPDAPAVANLLVHRWAVTHAAASATLVDLAARRHLSVERLGDGAQLIRVRTGTTGQDGSSDLRPFERHVVELVAAHAVDATLPAPALLAAAGPDWFHRFRRAVEAEAVAAGLARPRRGAFTAVWWAGWTAALAVPAHAFLDRTRPAALTATTDTAAVVATTGWPAAFGLAAIVAAVAVAAGVHARRGPVPTPAGRRAARHWLGVRRWYRDGGTFTGLQADAVRVWDRHLAYACALGAAPDVAGTFPLVDEHDDVVWSPAGGRWREVRVRVPRLVAPARPPRAMAVIAARNSLLGAAGLAAIGWLLLSGTGAALRRSAGPQWHRLDAATVPALGLLVGLPLLLSAATVRRWLPVLVATLADGSARTHTDGVLVAVPERTVPAGRHRTTTVRFSVVDDGRGATTLRAFPGHHPAIGLYRRVRVEHSPRSRYVYRITDLGAASTAPGDPDLPEQD